ncbi:LOW QUALITY PROTEIN: hypothetical protein Sjap_018951 [Stephania japonica]|uniref:AAA+ ATPase domain-containing protein n=1 Tax=Stephania japonica TaxID=461633 RepID=A0AAP0HXQ9_9MAGN
MGVLAFCQSVLQAVFPPELRHASSKLLNRLFNCFSSYCYFDITEIEGVNTNELYNAVQLYLSSSASIVGNRLSLSRGLNSTAFTFALSNSDSVLDTFKGVSARWEHVVTQRQNQGFSWRPVSDEKRGFTLRIRKKDRPIILDAYLDHIMDSATEIRRKSKERLLYTNSRGGSTSIDSRGPMGHPSTFDTLALDPAKKAEIMQDLRDFSQAQSFYHNTGRSWKRGYLLYGPPGTGKSSMIAAMANFLGYDIYDLELTEQQFGAQEAADEDDVQVDHSHRRHRLLRQSQQQQQQQRQKEKPPPPPLTRRSDSAADHDGDGPANSAITLSGLLNFTDGLWSCCGSERIFVFTTNHIDKLDPALLRSGRMDMHIFMTHCSFQALKILLRNYLGLEAEDVDKEVLQELEEVTDKAQMTPADISEVLIRKRRDKGRAVVELLELLKSRAAHNNRKRGGDKVLDNGMMTMEEEQEKRALDSPNEGSHQLPDDCTNKGGDDDDAQQTEATAIRIANKESKYENGSGSNYQASHRGSVANNTPLNHEVTYIKQTGEEMKYKLGKHMLN